MSEPTISSVRYAPAAGSPPAEALWLSEVWRRRVVPPLDRPQRIAFDLLMLAEGRGKHSVDFKAFDVNKGDAVLLPRGSAQRFDPDRRFEARLVLLPPRIPSPLVGQPMVHHRPSAPRRLLLHRLHDEMVRFSQAERGPGGHRVLLQLALTLFATAQPSATNEERPVSAIVRRFEALLREALPGERQLGWYTERLGCSGRTLQRACVEQRGEGPKALLDKALVTMSRRLLLDEDAPIAHVADTLHFSEPTNFSKWFKRNTGVTPRRFREGIFG